MRSEPRLERATGSGGGSPREIAGSDSVLHAGLILTGFVDEEDLAALYGGATAFAFPSLYEGFGLPPLEAMQCGVPVLSSNRSSLPEVVGDGGILPDPTDADAWSAAMLDLWLHADVRDRMSAAALRRAAQFSWKRCIEQTVQAYQAAVAAD